jgi:flagellar basal-body rod protein FlgF
MDNSIYINLSRQLALFRDMDVTANNIANTNTTAFNSEHIVFNTYVTKDINQGDRNPMAFANDIISYRDTSPGPMRSTGNELDVAIQSDGYFTVETPLGERYTRAGNFKLDGGGTLTTPDGYPVLDVSGQHIVFPENTTSVQIGGIGNIKVNGEDFATIGVVQFANPQLLERLDGKLFKSEIGGQPAENIKMAQGVLESANLQPVRELTHMITLTHTVADTEKFIETVYDLERKASNAWSQQS